METYYDVLNISKEATAIEIKKAYFSMVRKHTPERSPEKFMEIRHAYETLSNEDMRAEYNQWMDMPLFVRGNLNLAKELYAEGNNNRAISMLEELKEAYPEILMIQSLLGEVYITNNNPGKAIRTFENLVSIDPKNPSFAGNLAKSYLIRGWHKKALKSFKKAISLDEENVWLWLGLSEAYVAGGQIGEARKTLQKLLSMDHVKENLAVSIYFKLFLIDINQGNVESMKENLEQLSKMAVVMEEARDGIGSLLLAVANQMVEMQVFHIAKVILEKAWEIAPHNEEIKELKDKVDKFCNIEDEFANLELDDNYGDTFVALIASKIFPITDIDEEIYAYTADYGFLKDFHANKKYILMLEKQYPKIYNELKEYFEQVLDKRKRAKKIKEIEKFFDHHRGPVERFMLQQMLADDDDDEGCEGCEYCEHRAECESYGDDLYEPQIPYVRAEEKVGRNDPCPCGSGKKHKKCCGK